jgi:hypothetical protein
MNKKIRAFISFFSKKNHPLYELIVYKVLALLEIAEKYMFLRSGKQDLENQTRDR